MGLLSDIWNKVFETDTQSNSNRTSCRRNRLTRTQIERYRDYEVRQPESDTEHIPENHDVIWTMAAGVWHCRDCHVWYRIWEDEPYCHEDQNGSTPI